MDGEDHGALCNHCHQQAPSRASRTAALTNAQNSKSASREGQPVNHAWVFSGAVEKSGGKWRKGAHPVDLTGSPWLPCGEPDQSEIVGVIGDSAPGGHRRTQGVDVNHRG